MLFSYDLGIQTLLFLLSYFPLKTITVPNYFCFFCFLAGTEDAQFLLGFMSKY